MAGILRVIEGSVYEYNTSNQKVKTFYTKTMGEATRADWIENESVQIQLKDGKVIFVNRNCQVYKIFN